MLPCFSVTALTTKAARYQQSQVANDSLTSASLLMISVALLTIITKAHAEIL
jgi:hypothetical protein